MSIYAKVPHLLIVALVGSLGCFAQTVAFGVSPGSASPGATVTLDLSMDTSSGVSPASVQWTLTYPTTDFSSAAVTPAPVAAGAGKSISCTSIPGSSTCVLWGENSSAMPNGNVATIALVVSPTTQDASSQVQLSVPMAADPSGFPLTTAAAGTTVTILQPPALSGFSCLPTTVTPPSGSTCTIQLSADAPSGGASIALSDSAPDVTIPSTVMIPQGASSGTFTVVPLAVPAATPVNLTASYLGANEGFGLTINPAPVVLSSVSVNQNWLIGGATGSGVVTLSAPAGAGGVTVALSSSNSFLASVPISVAVAQGSTTAAFTVATYSVTAVSLTTITASYSGVQVSAGLSLNPRPHPLNGIQISPTTIQSGKTASGTVTLAAPAGTGGVVVYLFSSNNAALTVPSSITLAQGTTSGTFSATAGTVATNTNVAVTAFHAGIEVSTNVTVHPK
jgi:hypothetical protein